MILGGAMKITATELKSNLGKYLQLVEKEDVIINKNGKTIAVLSNPNKDRLSILNSLKGILPKDISENNIRNERLLSK